MQCGLILKKYRHFHSQPVKLNPVLYLMVGPENYSKKHCEKCFEFEWVYGMQNKHFKFCFKSVVWLKFHFKMLNIHLLAILQIKKSPKQ
jgi:hypothetical protein